MIMDIKSLRKTGFKELIDFTKARDDYLFNCKPLDDNELVSLLQARNRVLSETLTARIPIPNFSKSAMDGYAVKAADTFRASVENPRELSLVDSISIGEYKELSLEKGQAIKIATGAFFPDGADAVIKIEDTELDESKRVLNVYVPVVPGKNVIKKGEDYKLGQEVLKKGHAVTAQDLGALANLGYKRIKVMKKPRVTIFATGNELVDLNDIAGETGDKIKIEHLPPAKVINSNRYLIQPLIEQAGATVVHAGLLRDDETTIKDALETALDQSDMVITTGGTSVGEKDMLPVVIGKYHEVLHHGIAMKPGSATLIGFGKGKPILCLSGFPVAAQVGMLYFGIPAIKALSSATILEPRPEIKAKLHDAVPVKGFGLMRFLRVKLEKDTSDANALPWAIPVKLSGSSVQRTMIESDGIVELTENIEGYERGTIVNVRLHPN